MRNCYGGNEWRALFLPIFFPNNLPVTEYPCLDLVSTEILFRGARELSWKLRHFFGVSLKSVVVAT